MKKIWLFSSLVLSSLLLTWCFLIKPTTPVPENQDPKPSNFDQDFSEVASIFGVDIKDTETTSFEFTTPEQELYRVDGKKIKLSSSTPWKYHDAFAKKRYLDEAQSYVNGSFEGFSAYSKWNFVCLFHQILNTWNLSQSQIDLLNEKGLLDDWTELDYNLEVSCGDLQKAKKLSQHLDTIKIGDTVWWLSLKEKEITQNHAAFHLTGKTKVKGSIKLYQSEMTEESLIFFTPEKTSAKIFILTNREWENYSINLFEWNIEFSSFDSQTRQALLGGFELKVELEITEFYHIGRFESKYSSNIVIDNYKVIEE